MSLVGYKRRAEATTHEGEVFEKLDLRSMKAFGSKWIGCSFADCRFDLADLRASKFERTLFKNCSMPLVNLATSFFEDCMFVDCYLEGASFMGSHFRGEGFKNCRLAYGDTMFQDVTVKGSLRFQGCNLHGSNLDFREVEPDALKFEDCNLWGVKVSMGCAIWNPGTLDDRTVKQFLALAARVAQDPRIAELAGDQYAVVCRAMDGGAKRWDRDLTTSPATTSNPTQGSLAPRDTTQTTSLPVMAMTSSRNV